MSAATPEVESDPRVRELTQRNEALTRELAAAHAELDDILRIAGHDLRAPIRAVSHLIDWLGEDLRTGATSEAESHLALLSGRARRLSRMIDGLIDFGRAGRPTTHQGPNRASLISVAQAQVERLVSEPMTSRVELVAGSGAELELAHADTLALVLHRLLDNAARHAGRGGAPVMVTIAANQSDHEWLEVTLSDDGVGIDPRQHDRIWALFQTLTSRDQKDTTGVGLAVVKRLIERRVGGRVTIESAPGSGLTLRFTWPAVDQAER